MTIKDPHAVTPMSWRRATPSGARLSPKVQHALDGALEFFAQQSSRQAVLTRQLAGRTLESDAVTRQHLIRELRRTTRMDGSVNGSLSATAQALSELLDLDCPPDHAAVIRTLGFVLSCQNAPGHFGEGCDPARHAVGECRHGLQGFFSPATRDDEFTRLEFPSGIVIEAEEDARFAASCYALQVVLRAGEDRRQPVRDHIESLLRLASLWDLTSPRWNNNARALALAALAAAPVEYRPEVNRCVESFGAGQTDDGTWPDTDFLGVLDALARFATPAAMQLIHRALPALLALQAPDGSFAADAERTLIAVRVLAWATE